MANLRGICRYCVVATSFSGNGFSADHDNHFMNSNEGERERALRPRVGGRGGQAPQQRVPTFTASVLARAQKRFVRIAVRRPGRTGVTAYVKPPRENARRCAVKARVVKMMANGTGAAKLHLAYIERHGVERDGSEGRLYSADENLSRSDLTEPLKGEQHQFRFIVSPEEGRDLDLTAFTRDLMRRMEQDTGRSLIWGAVNHHDTENPHVHLVVRGVDRDGSPFRIERAYISERMRWQAQHLVTLELGPRSELDQRHQREREVTQDRLTSVDRLLAKVLSPDGVFDMRHVGKDKGAPERRTLLVGRVGALVTMGLAQKVARQQWRLADGWQDVLRSMGERGDIIKRIHEGLRGQGDSSRYGVIDGKSEHPPIEGIVRRKGLHDELTGDMYAVVETERGRAHYVRIDHATADSLREGSIVRVAVKADRWAKPADNVLVRFAADNGGIYDPKKHVAELASRPVVVAGNKVEPAEVIAVNLRRLKRLERHQLAVALPDGTWKVPPNLVELLGEREKTHPQWRTGVEVLSPDLQRAIHLVGPTWLDRAQENPECRARYGFGAEVSVAARERSVVLERLGVSGSPTEVEGALRELERRKLGEGLAKRSRSSFLPSAPTTFSGRATPCDLTPSGNAYVKVVDESTGRFVLLPASDIRRKWLGKTVRLRTDSKGRQLIRPVGLGRGE